MKPINGILAAAVSSLFLFNLPTAAMASNFQIYEAFSDDSEIELLCVDPSAYRAFYNDGNTVDAPVAELDLDALFGAASASGKTDHGELFILDESGISNCQVEIDAVKATVYE